MRRVTYPAPLPFLAITLASALPCTGPAAAQNLVHNGGFESPVIAGATKGFLPGTVGGWTVAVTSNVPGIYADGAFGYGNTTEGNQAWDMGIGGVGFGNTISQTLPTVAGQRYVLTFDWGSEFDRGTHGRVTVGDLQHVLVDDPLDQAGTYSSWIEHSERLPFLASGADVLTFADLTDAATATGPASVGGGLCLDGIVVALDSDGDALSDEEEAVLGTDELDADTDGDGLSDGEEVATYATNPLVSDTDGDGLSDGYEIGLQQFGCPDPLAADTDQDGLSDGEENLLGLDPCDNGDYDGDGLLDAQELLTYGTNPIVADTDGDGLFDGTEVDMAGGTGCPSALELDSDGDTLSDGVEVGMGTDPCSADTDGDTVPDHVDDLPTVPGVTSGFMEEDLRVLCEYVAQLDLSSFDAPNGNARKGRRNATCNKLNSAAKNVAKGQYASAHDGLQSLLQKLDGEDSPADWMVPGAAQEYVRDDIEQVVYLLSLGL